ncbi:2-phospho-L-lactate guanylyltransferase [Croceicoccus sp. F390]|uniref:2-phospho-L-lactate guanylyltransferase n=1 Tax=Croceicoccus esteveae TaxID=3075597 RepID=A0ABU2ZI79_9SPHN|nr:2-phospho-L-lactate guanylyltransferase [Croceicoccus sp. F390]MDT0576309.1 2-phospho-L-lactate guanylyltransferase [Croceicoccus sp. F390]
MAWTALVPIRIGIAGKSRLEKVMDAAVREKLAVTMAHHVIDVLTHCQAIGSVAVLSNMPFLHPATTWAKDWGRGLNPEISAFRIASGPAPLLVMHADLPLLEEADVEALLAAATGHGIALATDRAGEGTNVLALADGRPFAFRFGPGSRSLHCAQDADMPVLQRCGLSADLDTPDDLAFLRGRGLQF